MLKKEDLYYKLEDLQGVVFDMDGLMFDSERIVKDSWDAAGQILGYGKLGEVNICHTLGFNFEKRRQYFKGKYGEDFPFEKFVEEYRKAFGEYVKQQGLPAKPGLHELLETLQNLRIPMAIATSSSRSYALENLNRERIAHFFTQIVTGEMVKEAKPSPEIYHRAMQALGMKKDPFFYLALEDSIHGIMAAHRAGMITVMVPDLVTDSSQVDEILDGKASSLLEVAQWIQEVLERR